ncbi:hypothetical protein ACHAWT_002406, partial [Skeletonema menzelii]
MPRTKNARDKSQRKARKPMSAAEKDQMLSRRSATLERKERSAREKVERIRPAANFFNRPVPRQPPNAAGGERHNSSNSSENSAGSKDHTTVNEDGVEQSGDEQQNDEQHDKENLSEDEEQVITIDSTPPTFISPEDATPNLDIDDDDDDDLEEEDFDGDDDDDSNKKQQSKDRGVMREVLRAVQERIKYEESKTFPALKLKWMLEFIKNHQWSIPREHIPTITRKLGLQHEDVFKYYYTRLDVWLPDLQHGHSHMPCCVNCKHNNAVGVHGYSTHPGRMVVNQTENYYILTRRYICHDCKKKKERLKAIAKDAATVAANVEVVVAEVKLQTTFMGWDQRILPLFPDGIGKEFPAFLTKKAGVDLSLIDLMRPLINKGIRPEAFSELLLELHTKEWTRRYIKYERDVARKERLIPGSAKTASIFSDFSDKDFYDGRVPTPKYIKHVYNLFHDTISDHLAKEVKKRPAEILIWDGSYKAPKRMCQHNGEQIFNTLMTGMNGIGEVRLQFLVHTDSHDQMVGALEAFKATNVALGIEDPKYFVTDNPKADAAFITAVFDSLQQKQQKLDEQRIDTPQINPHVTYIPANVKVLKKEEVNSAIAAMWDVAKGRVIGLDAEWNVTMNRYGGVSETGKVALIQISYISKDDDEITTLLVRTHQMTKLPHRLESLLTGDTFKMVGVNVSADIIKIGKDFNISAIKQNKDQKDRPNVINLGPYARARDIVQNGSIGLKPLCELVLKKRLEKETHIRLSNWEKKDKLTDEQVKYAALDAITSLQIFLKITDMPDLTRRYTMDDVKVGNKVDLVPMFGSTSCMATRAATAIIVNVDRCQSPDDVAPKVAKAGKETVAIKLVKIYSTGFKIPKYEYKPSDSQVLPATLSCFGEGSLIVVPVHMLKHHVDSDHVRSTPAERSHPLLYPTVTVPGPGHDEISPAPDKAADTEEAADTGEALADLDEDENDGEDVRRNSFTEETISMQDIELIRAAAEKSTAAQSVENLFPCKGLSASPSPTAIVNKFSVCLGDTFHAMKRHVTPMHHEGKKAFFVALREAFLVWNKEKLEELKGHLRNEGQSEEEIEKKMLFTSTLFTDCVDRHIPPPSLLYFRVRAVFVLFGNLVDSKTKKPLFNERVWRCANNILDEILLGYYSDPPGVQWYTKRLRKNGTVETNKYGMELYDCSRGTNRVESFHKDLITTWGSWPLGLEMSTKVLAEKRHRHNHRVSERRRDGFPKVGHYDTWEIDELQLLVHKNRGFLLYPHWSNSSEYVSTEERFDIVPLQNNDVQQALETHCEAIAPLPKLTRDLQFQCNAMGTQLPFLPFSTNEERMKFSEYVHSLPSPLSANNYEKAAVNWCGFVDGISVWPKLPCHFRTYKRKWDKNQRCKDLFERSKSGRQKLAELNSIEHATSADASNLTDWKLGCLILDLYTDSL